MKNNLSKFIFISLLSIYLWGGKSEIHSITYSQMCISTSVGFVEDNTLALHAFFYNPSGIFFDKHGSLYIADKKHHRIRKIQGDKITSIAGIGIPGFQVDPIPAISAKLDSPSDIAIDSKGNIFIADLNNHCIQKIDNSNGTMSIYAGVGISGFSDKISASSAKLYSPTSIAIDADDNLYIADTGNHCIRIVYSFNNIIFTVAGVGEEQGDSGDGSYALTALLRSPKGVFVDNNKNIWIADTGNHKVKKIDGNSIIQTIAGCGTNGFSGDGGEAIKAKLDSPERVIISNLGHLYISDSKNNRIRKVENAVPNGTITTYAGGGSKLENECRAIEAKLSAPLGLSLDSENNLLIADSQNNYIRKIINEQSNRLIKIIAGIESNTEFSPRSSNLNAPADIISDSKGDYYIADTGNNIVIKNSNNLVTRIAGNGYQGNTGNGGLAIYAQLNLPASIIAGREEKYLYISEPENHWIRRVNLETGIINAAAGNEEIGIPKNNVHAPLTSINYPMGLNKDQEGNIYFADRNNHGIYKIVINRDNNPENIVRITGSENGVPGISEDGTHALASLLNKPIDLWIDQLNRIYITDSGNKRVVMIDSAGSTQTIFSDLELPWGIAGYENNGYRSLVFTDSLNHLIFHLDLTLYGPYQPYDNVIAGIPNSTGGLFEDSRPAKMSLINSPHGIDIDLNGDIIFADSANNRIRTISEDSCKSASTSIQTIAGFYHISGKALDTSVQEAKGMVTDEKGCLYYSDTFNHRVIKIDQHGNIKAVAGNGTSGFSGDNHDASKAQLSFPHGLEYVDGILYIADKGNHSIRQVDENGIITTLVGNGYPGTCNCPTKNLFRNCLNEPSDIAMDAYGDLYISDTKNHRIVFLTMDRDHSLQLTTTELVTPVGIAFDSEYNLYIADMGIHRILKIYSYNTTISTFAGTGNTEPFNDNVFADEANLYSPTQIVIDSSNHVYIADSGHHRVRIIKNNKILTIAGNSLSDCRYNESDIPVLASLNSPVSLALDHKNRCFIADKCHRILAVNPEKTTIQRIAGNTFQKFSGDNGPAISATLNMPYDVVSDQNGNLYISDPANHCIRKVSPDGTISTIAGNGYPGFSGDGSDAKYSKLNAPHGIAINHKGDIFIADTNNHRIRWIDIETLVIDTFAGTGDHSSMIDDGLASTISLKYPRGIAVDSYGNVYIADTGNHKIRKVDSKRNMTTIADEIYLNSPYDVVVDSYQNVYIADTMNHLIRKLSSINNIQIYAGNGNTNYSFTEEYKLATECSLYYPTGIFLDDDGNLFIADSGHNLVRKVMNHSQIIVSIAGNTEAGFSEDGQHPTYEKLNMLNGVTVDNNGSVIIADTDNSYVRKILTEKPSLPSPISCSCERTSETSILLNWEFSSDNAETCWIEKSKGVDNFYNWIKVIDCNADALADTQVVSSSEYEYKIYSYDNGIYSDYCKAFCPAYNGEPEIENNDEIANANELMPDTRINAELTNGDIDCFDFSDLLDTAIEISFFSEKLTPNVQIVIVDSQDNIVLSKKAKNEKFVCGFPPGKYYLKLRLQGNEAVSYNIQYQLQPENSSAYLTVINNGQGDVFVNGEHGLTNSFQMPFPKGSEIQLKGEPHDSGRILKWHTDSLESQINPALLVLDQHTIVYADFVAYSNNFQRVTKGIFDGYINENLYDSKENKIKRLKDSGNNVTDFLTDGHLSIAFDDIDKDGDSDLIYFADSKVHCYINEGSPKIHAWKEKEEINIGEFVAPYPAFMDFTTTNPTTNERHNDLFVVDQNEILYFKKSKENPLLFTPEKNIDFISSETSGFSIADISFSDIDSDDDLDLFVLEKNSSQIHCYIYDGIDFKYSFNFSSNINELSYFDKVFAISVIDMNQDNISDLLIGARGGIYLFLNNNDNWKLAEKLIDLPENLSGLDFSAIDIDNDSDIDIFYTISDQGFFFYENTDNILEITPIMSTIEKGESIQYSCVSHEGPVTWTIIDNQSGGSIDSHGGMYTSGTREPGFLFDWKTCSKTIAPNSELTSTIDIPYDYTTTKDLSVFAEIHHPQLHTLKLKICSPDGDCTPLSKITGTKVRKTFLVQNSSDINIHGCWMFSIVNERDYTGTLHHWSILSDEKENKIVDVIEARHSSGKVNYAYANIVHKYDITKSGIVMIVAGTISNDSIKKGIRYLSTFAYDTFRYMGYSDENILFFSPHKDFHKDYPSESVLFEDTLLNKLSTDNLIIYFVTHGASMTHDPSNEVSDYIYLTDNDILTGSQIKQLLDAYQEKIGKESHITVIFETCNAKKIMNKILSDDFNRTVFTSSEDFKTWIVADGRLSFSNFFFSKIFINQNLWKAFSHASNNMFLLFKQKALVKTSPNQIANEYNDIDLSSQKAFAPRVFGADRPVILNGPDSQMVSLNDEKIVNIWAEMYSHYPITRSWVNVKEVLSNKTFFDDSDDLNLKTMRLDYTTTDINNYNWSTSFNVPQMAATYELSIFSEDIWGNISIPYSFCIKRTEKEKIIIISSESNETEFENLLNDIMITAEKKGFNKDDDIYSVSHINSLSDIKNAFEWASDANKLILCVFGFETLTESGEQAFQLNNNSEILTASALKENLDLFQNNTNTKRVMIINEMINQNNSEPEAFFHDIIVDDSTRNVSRSIISNRSNCNSYTNLFFTNLIFSEIKSGKTFEESYNAAIRKISITQSCITRNSHVLKQSDKAITQNFSFGIEYAGDDSNVIKVYPDIQKTYQPLDEIVIGAQIDSYTSIDSAYAFIKIPGYSEFQLVNLSFNKNEMRFETSFTLLQMGLYTVELLFRVKNGGLSKPKEYSFKSLLDESKQSEPNNDWKNASLLYPGFPEIHSFQSPNDVDWFKFWLNEYYPQIISITNVCSDSNADLTDEIFPECSRNDNKKQADEHECSYYVSRHCSGMYYFKIENKLHSDSSNTCYQIVIKEPSSGLPGYAKGFVFDYCGNKVLNGYILLEDKIGPRRINFENGYYRLSHISQESETEDVVLYLYTFENKFIGSQSLEIKQKVWKTVNLETQLIDLNCNHIQDLSDLIYGLTLVSNFSTTGYTQTSMPFCTLNSQCKNLETIIRLLKFLTTSLKEK